MLLFNSSLTSTFTTADIEDVRTLCMLCGIGIHNSIIYERTRNFLVRQWLAMDLLKYHAVASEDEVTRYLTMRVRHVTEHELHSFEFDDMKFPDDETPEMVRAVFEDLNMLNIHKIPKRQFVRWVLTVRKNYRPVQYHNWKHALNVMQMVFCVLTTGGLQQWFDEYDQLAFLIATISHDLDHRGTNNAFQIAVGNPLGYLYSTSTMERHHFTQ